MTLLYDTLDVFDDTYRRAFAESAPTVDDPGQAHREATVEAVEAVVVFLRPDQAPAA